MLRKPGVHAVRGNHDQWCIVAGLVGEPEGHKQYGGGWFYSLTAYEKRYIAELLNKLPVAISFIGSDGKKYGVVNAECTYHEWSWFEEVLTGQWGESSQERHVTEDVAALALHETGNLLCP
jgi:serine/threonine protein phosphatase 1